MQNQPERRTVFSFDMRKSSGNQPCDFGTFTLFCFERDNNSNSRHFGSPISIRRGSAYRLFNTRPEFIGLEVARLPLFMQLSPFPPRLSSCALLSQESMGVSGLASLGWWTFSGWLRRQFLEEQRMTHGRSSPQVPTGGL